MFGKRKRGIQDLEEKVAALTRQVEDLKKSQEEHLRLIRRQVAGIVSGIPSSPKSILDGLPYSEIPKEQVLAFIQSIPNLLILDVRSDQGWTNGHIPNAKHIPAQEVFQRIGELADKARPILTVCANGNTAVSVCQMLAREGYQNVFNALGGMAGYQGELTRPEIQATDVSAVRGNDRNLVHRVLEIIDLEIRPGLKRDGGDLQVLEVEAGIVKVKMVGACVGCGAQKRTVEEGIKKHLMSRIPEIQGVEDHSLGLPN